MLTWLLLGQGGAHLCSGLFFFRLIKYAHGITAASLQKQQYKNLSVFHNLVSDTLTMPPNSTDIQSSSIQYGKTEHNFENKRRWELLGESHKWSTTHGLSCSSTVLLNFGAYSVVSDSLWHHELKFTRLFCPWIFNTKILVQIVISSSRGSCQSRDQTHISCISCFGKQDLYNWATRDALSNFICL